MNEPPVSPLPRRVQAMLAAYRDEEAMPEEVDARIWSVVGAEDVPEPAFEPPERESRPAIDRRLVTWVAMGVAAAAVLLVAWSLGGRRAERSPAGPPPDAASMQGGSGSALGRVVPKAPKKARPVEPPREPAAPPREPTAKADRNEPKPRAVPKSVTTAGSAADPPSPTADPAPPRSTLAEEKALVARAWRALASKDEDQALDLMETHRRRFAFGLLAPERAAIEVIARCRRGGPGSRTGVGPFHRAYPGSPLASRVDEACDESVTP